MLEIGQIFEKNGYEFCVLDIIDYNMKKYVLFSIEAEKVEYAFYEINFINDRYNLKKIDDNLVECTLFNIFETKGV